jgi:hypothetical protein
LTLQRSEDSMQIQEARVKAPDDAVEQAFPIFCARLRMARLVSRFCLQFQEGTLKPSQLGDRLAEIDMGLEQWKDSLPANYRPGADFFLAEDEDTHLALIVHLEYYAVSMAMFSALQDAVKMFPISLRSHRSLRIRNASKVLVQTARSVLQTLVLLSDTPHLRHRVSCWLVRKEIYSTRPLDC